MKGFVDSIEEVIIILIRYVDPPTTVCQDDGPPHLHLLYTRLEIIGSWPILTVVLSQASCLHNYLLKQLIEIRLDSGSSTDPADAILNGKSI